MSLTNPNARFVLDHKQRKADCPACGYRRTFRLYIDRHTGVHLPEHVGVCDRENNCAYSYTAAQWIKEGGMVDNTERVHLPPPPPRRTDWRCPEHFVAHTHQQIPNNLLLWFSRNIGHTDVERQYRVGTFPKGKNYPQYEGAMVFWQIGMDGKERSGKVIQYDKQTGKRVKELKAMWMHTVVTKQSMDELGCAQVYFGTHLLKDRPYDPVALVESEKTAMICASLYKSYVWLATGGSNMISAEKSQCLAGRDVTIFPDSGCYHQWVDSAMSIDVVAKSGVVSDILECVGAPEGDDIADWLVPINAIAAMGLELFQPREIVEEPEAYVPKVHQSPLDKFIQKPNIAAFIQEMDIDVSQATIRSL